jgi:hypothetical protein
MDTEAKREAVDGRLHIVKAVVLISPQRDKLGQRSREEQRMVDDACDERCISRLEVERKGTVWLMSVMSFV